MATRLLLTMLAILTGLAAQLSPAHARACAGVNTEIGEVAGASATQRGATAVAQASRPAHRNERSTTAAVRAVSSQPAPVIPAVLQGIDRARE